MAALDRIARHIGFYKRELPVVSCGLSVEEGELPVVDCGLSVEESELAVVGCGLSVEEGELPVVGCGLSVKESEFPVVGCGLSVEEGDQYDGVTEQVGHDGGGVDGKVVILSPMVKFSDAEYVSAPQTLCSELLADGDGQYKVPKQGRRGVGVKKILQYPPSGKPFVVDDVIFITTHHVT